MNKGREAFLTWLENKAPAPQFYCGRKKGKYCIDQCSICKAEIEEHHAKKKKPCQ
jgi:hypothetical protein